MAGLEELREKFPDLANASDEELVAGVSQRSGVPPERVLRLYGGSSSSDGAKATSGDFVPGIQAGWRGLKGTTMGAVGLAGDALNRKYGVGEGLSDWGYEGYVRNMDKVQDTFKDSYTFDGATDSLGDFVDAAQYYAGRVIPDAAAALTGGGIGAVVGKKVLSEGAEAAVQNQLRDKVGDTVADAVNAKNVGSVSGIYGQATAGATGEIYGGARREALANGGSVEDVNLNRVLGYGALSGGTEAAADILTLGAGKLGPAKNLMDAVNDSGVFRRVGARGAAASGVEAVTEGVQSGLEDMGMGRSASEADFFNPTAMMAGAMGGGAIGGVGGLMPAQNSATELNEELVAQDADCPPHLAFLAAWQHPTRCEHHPSCRLPREEQLCPA